MKKTLLELLEIMEANAMVDWDWSEVTPNEEFKAIAEIIKEALAGENNG